MTYRVIETTIVDDQERVVFDALDNKLIRRELCVWMNTARAEAERSEYAEARAAELLKSNRELAKEIVTLRVERDVWQARALSAENLWHMTEAERDALAEQLKQAQIEIKRLEYRLKNTWSGNGYLDRALNEGDGVYRP